ncbi:DUF3017 domain-containing protein [Streptomyces badius]|uniref:DUF3017 domain-containing protein n=3 Tax=Streptomyces TaxID=1883 RepID=A0ABQ2T8X1_STRBA|nr:DUF3017 domain-containing protein [Streptomyces badius]GGS55004.1 hypothetical protein GCM10010253_31760 [Streptomyces badius]
MGAGRSPADPAPADRAADVPDRAADVPDRADGTSGPGEPAGPSGRDEADGQGGREAGASAGAADAQTDAGDSGGPAGPGNAGPGDAGPGNAGPSDAGPGDAGPSAPASAGRPRRSRRFPRFTRDTARPEGGGRAASGDAPAPARQWPLLTVLCAAGLGLLIVVLDPFDQAFRIGTILIGGALIAGAVLRWVVSSVGMLAVRSRFTDLVTYGVMGTLIVLLALVAQPEPWLDVPILEDAVRFTIR